MGLLMLVQSLGCWRVMVVGSSPSALARRPRVQPRQGAWGWRSSRATVVRLMPA